MNATQMSFVPGLAIAATVLLAFTGCASSPTVTTQNTNEAKPSSEASSEPGATVAGEAPISTDHVCGQVTTLSTLERNTVDAFAAGTLSADKFVAQMNMVTIGYEHVLVDDSEVGERVSDVVSFLKSAPASAEGARVDPDSSAWQSAISAVSVACQRAGSSVSALADLGG